MEIGLGRQGAEVKWLRGKELLADEIGDRVFGTRLGPSRERRALAVGVQPEGTARVGCTEADGVLAGQEAQLLRGSRRDFFGAGSPVVQCADVPPLRLGISRSNGEPGKVSSLTVSFVPIRKLLFANDIFLAMQHTSVVNSDTSLLPEGEIVFISLPLRRPERGRVRLSSVRQRRRGECFQDSVLSTRFINRAPST
jgi:hypothetical protein